MRIHSLAIVVLAGYLASAFGQPATLTLRAKLRDFKDHIEGDATTHPDFENDGFMGCGGSNLGYVRNTIDANGAVDPALYPDDNRGPVLVRTHHPTFATRQCFTSIARFGEWYNDHAANRSFYIDLVLTRNAQGMYVFNDDNFLPLNDGNGWRKFRPADPDPFGPRADITPDDVWGFTMELHTTFTYLAGQGQTFTFKGDDDVWAFINGRLAIDLGGLHDQLTATVNLDQQAAALGLVNGASYPLDFFFAERHSTGSHCQITTSLQLGQLPQLPTPVATPPGQVFRNSITVSLAVPGHADAQIRYTTDGSEPTEASPLYNAALTFTGNTTLKAKAFKADFLASATLTEVYTLEQVKLPTPVADPAGRTFNPSVSVSLSVPGHADAVIRYTLDGSDPGPASPVYSAALVLSASTTVKAQATKPGWLPSDILVETYTFEKLQLPVPVAVPPGQSFKGTLNVTLSVPGHPDAVIRYTLDGRDPDSTSPVYSSPLVFAASDTLKARAFKADWLPSGVLTEVYLLIVPPNVISLRMDSTLILRGETFTPAVPEPVKRNPILLVASDGGVVRCLSCPAGTGDTFLRPGLHPEWTVSSRSPFKYEFRVYDHLGHFVVAQKGEVTRTLADQLPADAAGYRTFRFRWIPVAHDGRPVGTGAYILRGRVVSEKADKPTAEPGRPETTLLKVFGFVRRD